MSSRTIRNLARRGWSPWRIVVLALAIAALTPAGAAASGPAPVDCTGMTLSACYNAAKAAGWPYISATPVGQSCANDTNCLGDGGAYTPGDLIMFDTGGSPTTSCAAGAPCFYIAYTVPDGYSGTADLGAGSCGEPPGAYCFGDGAGFAAAAPPPWFASDLTGGSASPSGPLFSIAPVASSASWDLGSDLPTVLLLVGGLIAFAVAVHFARKAIRA